MKKQYFWNNRYFLAVICSIALCVAWFFIGGYLLYKPSTNDMFGIGLMFIVFGPMPFILLIFIPLISVLLKPKNTTEITNEQQVNIKKHNMESLIIGLIILAIVLIPFYRIIFYFFSLIIGSIFSPILK